MKTLGTVLKELGSETEVAIGTNKGSNYLIFCKAGETARINEAFEKCRKKAKETIAIQKLRLNNLVMIPPFVDSSTIAETIVMDRAAAILKARNTLTNAMKYYDGYHNNELANLVKVSNTLFNELNDTNKRKFQVWLDKKMKEEDAE